MNKNERVCPDCGGAATYKDAIFECKSCGWKGWTDAIYKPKDGTKTSKGITSKIIEYLKEHKSVNGEGIGITYMASSLDLDIKQLGNALQRILKDPDRQIVRVKYGRYEHTENFSSEKPTPSKKEPEPKKSEDINATLGGDGGSSCSVEFFTHTISHLTKEHGGRQVNQSELGKLIKLTNEIENLFKNLRPRSKL